ncbi:MAG: complex I NDUFA9 subunit family protein [Alphaproteobacteria bacterium]|jgi:uncharacterized protein YbjT (DUF2867 family)|nr:complex I NDUFA9 subunit family protein [Alphaproteobacteria bacterium]MBT5389158.1 complex I NDUFA9 subunit family protein [Alphaproteobacteria bacterium]MBT5540205.1 complex I NDUFA9 subunit family protein [Alphaproteobacteria bacterium]MBT5655039.1 complex I NDUFA9 subunit family protein [Alphaproteobacteria bacterium]
MDLRGKRVTVFGGSGFVGRYVVQSLAKNGAMITVACRNVERALFLKTLGEIGQISLVSTNVIDPKSVARALENADMVVNLVGILFEAGKQTFKGVHENGPERMAQLAKKAGVERFVHISAIGADSQSRSKYGKTKFAGETRLRKKFPEVTIVRPSIIFGAEDAFFNRFASMACISPFLPLIGGGKTQFQPVYVCDIAEVVCRILMTPQTIGKLYELGGPNIYSFKSLMQIMLEQIHRKRLLIPIPFWMASCMGAVFGLLPNPPLTLDQVRLLRRNNIVSEKALGFKDFGIDPLAMEAILPTYLDRFCPVGSK